jgi:GAF domain-containing protein
LPALTGPPPALYCDRRKNYSFNREIVMIRREAGDPQGVGRDDLYRELATILGALIAGEPDAIANTANMAALLFERLPEINWAGFYFLRQDVLVLGPFQGRPACVRIPLGTGVCGTAAARGEPIVVADVHEFPGHIACDPQSRAELVVPLVAGARILGVLDLDSPRRGRFEEADRAGCATLVALLLAHHARHGTSLLNP